MEFIAGDLLEIDLGSGYDVAVSLEVLAHIADQELYLKRLHGPLKPGGQLMLAELGGFAAVRVTVEAWSP